MDITGPHLQANAMFQAPAASGTKTKVGKDAQEQAPITGASEDNAGEDQAVSSDGSKGVIRNILEGHYKGVADVRLRIVHHEELAAIENEQLKANAGPEVEKLLAAVEAAASQIPEPDSTAMPEALPEVSGEPGEATSVSDLYNVFAETVRALGENFQSSETPAVSEFVNGVQNAFAEFLASLHDLLIPSAEEAIAPLAEDSVQSDLATQDTATQDNSESGATSPDAIVPAAVPDAMVIEELVEPLPQEEPVLPASADADYEGLLGELSSAFAAAVAELERALNATSSLPELSGPTGSGKAYEKFLAIYNELWGIQPPGDNSGGSEPVDVFT